MCLLLWLLCQCEGPTWRISILQAFRRTVLCGETLGTKSQTVPLVCHIMRVDREGAGKLLTWLYELCNEVGKALTMLPVYGKIQQAQTVGQKGVSEQLRVLWTWACACTTIWLVYNVPVQLRKCTLLAALKGSRVCHAFAWIDFIGPSLQYLWVCQHRRKEDPDNHGGCHQTASAKLLRVLSCVCIQEI